MKKSFKDTCIELRRKDHTLNEIVKITGRSKTSIYFHIKNIPLSSVKRDLISEASRARARDNSAKRKGVSARPFSKFSAWTPELVLLVAHLMFDGELYKKKCRYHNRNQTLISRVERIMGKVYRYPPSRYKDRLSGVVTISFNNVALGAYLYERSQDLISAIVSSPKRYQREFIRAFFDDEGCMYYRLNRRQIRGYQKNKQILFLVQALLVDFGIDSSVKEPNEVIISGKENLIKFRDQINFSQGVTINPNRTNSLWKKNLEKRKLLDMAIASFQK